MTSEYDDDDNDVSIRDITPTQSTAIDAIVSGATRQDAATAAGVHRVTVSEWANHHPGFQAELNRRRNEIEQTRTDQIRHLDELALASLRERIETGDADAVDTWIKARGLAKANTSAGIGPTDPNKIIDREVTQRYIQAVRDEDNMTLCTDDAVNRSFIADCLEDELYEKAIRGTHPTE